MPKDNRKYREKNLQSFVNTHTFHPSMVATKSKELAEQYHKKMRAERSKSRDNYSKSIKDNQNPFEADKFHPKNDNSSPSIILYDEKKGAEDNEATYYEM